jgi:hypothetical protein
VRWTRRRSGAESGGAAGGREEAEAPAGYERPGEQARLAELRGREAGAVRLPERHALGLDAPAVKELRAIGRMRQAIARRRGAQREQSPRSRIKSADKREDRARQRHAGLNERLGRLREEVRPAHAEAMHVAQRELADLDRAYRNLPVVERGLPGLRRGWVEGVATTVAFFDAVFMKYPLEQAGISGRALPVLVAGIGFVIFGSIHACGAYGGMLSLRLSTRDRRQAATLMIAAIVVLLVIGFVLLGWLRHEWTAQSNELIRKGRDADPPLLDLLFLTPLQIAGALGAAGLLAVYEMGDAGRRLRAALARAERRLTLREQELRQTDHDIHRAVPNAIEEAALEVHEVRVDKANAEIELATIQAETAAQLEFEEHLTDGAVNRYRVEYETTDRKFANGRSHFARHPDGFFRHWRRWAVDDARDDARAQQRPGDDVDPSFQMPLDELQPRR